MVETGERMGKQMVALITDIEPAARLHGGNALKCGMHRRTTRRRPRRSRDLATTWRHDVLSRRRVQDGGRCKRLSEQIIASGQASRVSPYVELQGGDISVIDDPTRSQPITASMCESPSRIRDVHSVRTVGTACVILGGGRERKEDSVDPAVGIVVYKKTGDKVSVGEPLCTIHCHSDAQAARAKTLLEESYQIAALRRAQIVVGSSRDLQREH